MNDFIFVLQMQLLAHGLSMAKELGPSYWTMWAALALNLDFMTVVTMALVFITVPTVRMLVPPVRFNVSDIYTIAHEKIGLNANVFKEYFPFRR